MGRTYLKRFTILTLAVFGAATTYAWGPQGHRVVALIAYDHLTPAAKARVNALLKKDTDLDGAVGPERLAAAAVWPDEIKSEPHLPVSIFASLNVNDAEESKPLHYCDLAGDKYDAEKDCKDHKSNKAGVCIINGIDLCRTVLKDKDASDEDRIEAIKFLVHFVGDAHQPLHAGRASDGGGNDIKLDAFLTSRSTKKHQINLHEVWDSSIIRKIDSNTGRLAQQLSEAIETDDEKAWSASLDPIAWIEDSHRIAIEKAYVDENGQAFKLHGDSISKKYVDRARPIVTEQLQKAGVRLAAMLNESFAQ